jgi:hypothetical protein
MRFYSVMFAPATVPLSLPSLRTGRGPAVSFAAGGSFTRSGRYVAPFIEIVVFAMLLALIAFPAPARAQTFTMSSVAAAPTAVQPGKTVVFTDTITANQNASNYNFAFLLSAPGGSNVAQQFFTITAKAGVPLTEAYGWTVPAGAKPGTYSMETAVFNPAWSQILVSKTIALTVTAASAMTYPTLLEAPVVSGTAQVGNVLTSTTGTWRGATSFAYQWSGNKTAIAGATAATYTPVANDVGHTLTSTVVATGSPGALSSATSAATVPIVAASSGSPTASAGGSVPFVALHTYYMSPTGSDSNNGTSAATPWATLYHSVVCGDVIIAAAGSYSDLQSWGKVSNCPSTSGGIDGTGGIYFATVLCGGSYVGACFITTKTSTICNCDAFDVHADNWAVEGWYANTSQHGNGFHADGSGGLVHHIAFINDISANNNTVGFGSDDGGKTGAFGVDYFAVVGSIAQNSAGQTCNSAIDGVGISPFDTNAGTHVYFYGDFSYANHNVPCLTISDTEDYMFDTWDFHNVPNQGVIANNIGFDADRMCIQTFEQNNSTPTPIIKIYNNTCFQNNNNNDDNLNGEINVAILPSVHLTYIESVTNNLAYQPLALATGGGRVAAFAMYNPASSTFVNNGNFYRANNSSCKFAFCNSTFDAETQGASTTLGTNTYTNPAFTNTADLLANRTGVPNCNAFTNTTQCMGWNANTSTLTTPSIISDLVPTASGTAGKGYQLPSITCAANADYPAWLKGIVYLQWNGSTLSENSGLVTRPCNM